VELEPIEVLHLRPLFPHLAGLLDGQHPRLREVPANVVTAAEVERDASDVAQVTAVPEPYRKRVRGPGYALAVNLRGLISVGYMFGGLGLAVAGIWLSKEGQVLPGVPLIAVGAAGAGWGVYVARLCLGVYENRWIRRQLCREISRRPDARVRDDDPDALYVSIIPRDSFITVKWTMASDVLLLKLDLPKRQILLEGDADRYRIPAGALLACEPQCFFHPLDAQKQNQLWMTRLMVRVDQGNLELLVCYNPINFRPHTNQRRRERAESLCARIREFMGDAPRTSSHIQSMGQFKGMA
jgi:hypothetical protein